MYAVRVFQLARDLGLSSTETIERLKRLGVEAKTASSSVDEDAADKLKRALKIDALTASKRRVYGSDEDEPDAVRRLAAERAARERAAEEARQAAEARKSREGERLGAAPGVHPPGSSQTGVPRPTRPVAPPRPVAPRPPLQLVRPSPETVAAGSARTVSPSPIEERLRLMWTTTVKHLENDPQTALVQARKTAEALLQFMEFGRILTRGGKDQSLDALLQKQRRRGLPTFVERHLDTIRQYGNVGAHPIPELEDVDADHALPAITALRAVLRWYCREHRLGWQP